MAERLDTALDASPVLAIVRYPGGHRLAKAVRALAAGGIQAAEVTSTTPGWLDAIAETSSGGEGLLVGGGTVLTVRHVRDVAAAGGAFVVSPGLDAAVVRQAQRLGLVPIPGVFTGTEVSAAVQLGVTLLKLFPAGSVGPGYLRQLRGPFPDLRFVPTGGLSAADAASWFDAGAYAVGLGADLAGRATPLDDVEDALLTERAQRALAGARRS